MPASLWDRRPLSRAVLSDPDDPLQAWFDSRQRLHRVLSDHGQRLADLILTLTLRAEQRPYGLTDMPEDLLMDDIVSALRDAIDAAPDRQSGLDYLGPASRRRLALAAEELIRAGVNDGSLLSIEAVCRQINTSQRSLQVAFLEQFGISARTFVLSARMQRAHALLLSAGDRMTVTEIATQSGIWHLGRFSKYYKQFFGCTPLQTQRRIWARPVLGPEI